MTTREADDLELDTIATEAVEASAPRALAGELLKRRWGSALPEGGAAFEEARGYVEGRVREGQRARLKARPPAPPPPPEELALEEAAELAELAAAETARSAPKPLAEEALDKFWNADGALARRLRQLGVSDLKAARRLYAAALRWLEERVRHERLAEREES